MEWQWEEQEKSGGDVWRLRLRTQKEIITLLKRIIKESKKTDERNSEGVVVDVSDSHLMTLLHQNLATIEKFHLVQLKSPTANCCEALKSSSYSVVNLTLQDVPEQCEPFLTMLTLGIHVLEQPHLELSLLCSQSPRATPTKKSNSHHKHKRFKELCGICMQLTLKWMTLQKYLTSIWIH